MHKYHFQTYRQLCTVARRRPSFFLLPLREMDLTFVNIYFQYAFKNLASIKKYRVIGERVSQSLFLCENKPVLEIDRTVALHINRVQQLKSQK